MFKSACIDVPCVIPDSAQPLVHHLRWAALHACRPPCRVLKEFGIKGCKEARFSRGGQHFAALSGTTVQLHATYTCESLGVIRCSSQLRCKERSQHMWSCMFDDGRGPAPALILSHINAFDVCRAQAAKVRSLWWSPDDTTLLTCGADGAVFQWRVAGLVRLRDFTLQAGP
jgi:cilia- and flagella-associated protein 57